MTDVIELIENHHREIEDLFAKFESTQDAPVAFQLCDELDRHATAEEQVIYPVIAAEVPGGREMVGNGNHDHREGRALADRIRRTSDPEQLADLVGALKLTVAHHVDEEETEVLPLTRAALEPERLAQLGADFATARG
jgi:hemerythrin superfamily protein